MLTALSKNRLKFLHKLKHKKYRESENLFLISGLRAVQSALENPHTEVLEAFCTNENTDRAKEVFKNARDTFPLFSVSRKDFDALVDEKTPQGIGLVLRRPATYFALPKVSGNYIFFLDRVNDPGNLGTIIRSAVWFGYKTIILSRASVDPFHPKVVRASAGTILNITVLENAGHADLMRLKEEQDYTFLATDINDGRDISAYAFPQKAVILLGSEAHGLDTVYHALCDEKLTIPRYGESESLNLANAAAIIMFQAKTKTMINKK